MRFTDEDVKLVEKFIDIKNRGYYVSGVQLTEVYNRVLNKRVSPTSCGSCLRQRVNELEVALNQFKKLVDKSIEVVSEPSESISEVEVDNTKVEDKKPVRGLKNKK